MKREQNLFSDAVVLVSTSRSCLRSSRFEGTEGSYVSLCSDEKRSQKGVPFGLQRDPKGSIFKKSERLCPRNGVTPILFSKEKSLITE